MPSFDLVCSLYSQTISFFEKLQFYKYTGNKGYLWQQFSGEKISGKKDGKKEEEEETPRYVDYGGDAIREKEKRNVSTWVFF